MSDDHYRQGRRRLRELLPWARAEARKPGYADSEIKEQSALGRASFSHVTEDNLDALVIYPAPLGGWHADLVLKHVPPGVPNTIGSPVGSPFPTRSAAEDGAKKTLVMMLVTAARNRASPAASLPPVFILYGWSMDLLPALFEEALALFPDRADGYGSKEAAAARIEETLAALCPAGFDGVAFNDWSHGDKVALMTVLHIAALSGVFAYPLRRDAPPASETRH